MTTEVAVLVPVLGRPHNVAPLVESFLEARTVPSQLVFICTPDDAPQITACEEASEGGAPLSSEPSAPSRFRLPWDVVTLVLDQPAGPGDFARKINAAHRALDHPYAFQAADDVMFCPGWDQAALAVADKTGAGVVGTNDHGNPTVTRGHHSTHSLIRRTYIETVGGSLDGPGIVFSLAYGHQYVDTELVELAKSRRQWAFAREAAVCHEHPFWDSTVPTDATYRKGQASAAADRRLYLERSRQWKPLRRSPA